MGVPNPNELTEENAENAVIYISNGFIGKYEWVFSISDTLVNGRKLTPHYKEGELVEFVSEMGDYYGNSLETLKNDATEVIGYARQREDAIALAENHKKNREE